MSDEMKFALGLVVAIVLVLFWVGSSNDSR